MKITPKNWREFQHYKDRNPPWIRLHKALLDNYEFQCLPVASRALAPMLWLLASAFVDGVIDADLPKLAFRLRQSEKEIDDALKPLIQNGFFELQQDAINVLAERKQLAVPETETETETEKPQAAPRPARKCPSSFVVTEDLIEWALTRAQGVSIEAETEKFRDHTFKTPLSDWPGAWRNWMRKAVEYAPAKSAVQPAWAGAQ